jgi:hypothetical protein
MYAVFQSGRGWSSLSEAIKTRLVALEKISFAEEALELTSNHVDQILFNDVKRLDSWKHSKKPCKSKSKRTKFY